jgi:hypothetical protein
MDRQAPSRAHHVNQAEVAGVIAGYFNVPASMSAIGELSRLIFPDVQMASRRNPAGWRSVVLGLLANRIGMARSLGLQGSELQRQLQIMRASNRTSADFAVARARVQALVAGMGGWSRVAQVVEAEASGRTPSSNDYAAITGYAADRLPVEMRRWIGGGCDAHHVAGVGNYLIGLGLLPHEVHEYTGYFVGSSQTGAQCHPQPHPQWTADNGRARHQPERRPCHHRRDPRQAHPARERAAVGATDHGRDESKGRWKKRDGPTGQRRRV